MIENQVFWNGNIKSLHFPCYRDILQNNRPSRKWRCRELTCFTSFNKINEIEKPNSFRLVICEAGSNFCLWISPREVVTWTCSWCVHIKFQLSSNNRVCTAIRSVASSLGLWSLANISNALFHINFVIYSFNIIDTFYVHILSSLNLSFAPAQIRNLRLPKPTLYLNLTINYLEATCCWQMMVDLGTRLFNP